MDENIVRWLVCGASAGLAVDLGLYPLDTIKTRLQIPVFLSLGSLVHALSASIAEIVACAIRVPTELVKQRSQASKGVQGLSCICNEIYRTNGLRGFYRGYLSTVFREIPFSVIEFPLWEILKKTVARRKGQDCTPFEGAACGSVAGSFAAGITTPLDVAKTRIMLSRSPHAPSIFQTLKDVYAQGGFMALYSGVTPRILWMAAGGFVFFGAYDSALSLSYWIYPDSAANNRKKIH
uniref:S-adenosylmethionine mitochondrial carrier protein n=1 Tax=Heterorhabditis bacteriophora TaxID=37862 RepID=A0A1I7XQL7_HETBA